MSGHVGSVLRQIRDEAWGLFVDDGVFAGAIVVWVVVAAAALPRLGIASALQGLVLFLGLALILIGGALRRARQG